MSDANLREYAFDVTLLAAIRVQAATRQEAEAALRAAIQNATCNAGAWPNGDPIVFEASVEGELDLYEVCGIDGEPLDERVSSAAPKFRMCNQHFSLEEMLEGNASDEEFCAWAQLAMPGDVYTGIGERCECVAGDSV